MFLSRGRVKLTSELYAKAAERAQAQGCASVDQYVIKLVEADLKVAHEQALKAKVLEKMKTLGYSQ